MSTINLIHSTQHSLYSKLRNFSYNPINHPTLHKNLGRLLAVPVAVLDTVLDVVKYPLAAIEHIASAALNFLGAPFFEGYTIKAALNFLERSFTSIADLPIALAMAPFKILYQTVAILRDPVEAVPFISPPTTQSRNSYAEWLEDDEL